MGFWDDDVPLSPKFQDQLVIPGDVPEKLTINGTEHESVSFAVKLATGCGLTAI